MSEPKPRSLFRISLFRVLVLMTLLALGAGLYGAYRNNASIRERALLREAKLEAEMAMLEAETARVRAENRKLRAQLGFLSIEDKEMIHAVRLKERIPRNWTYRVYLPPGQDYYAACRVNNLPLDKAVPSIVGRPPGINVLSTLDRDSVGMGLSPGEYLITFTVFTDLDGQLRYRFDCNEPDVQSLPTEDTDREGGAQSAVLRDETKWPFTRKAFSTSGVNESQTVAAATEPLVLLDGRSFEESSKDATEGVLVWVGPAE